MGGQCGCSLSRPDCLHGARESEEQDRTGQTGKHSLFKLFLCNHNQGFHGNQENTQINDLIFLGPTIHGTTWPFCS